MLQVEHIYKRYGKQSVLEDCHLTIQSGEIIGIMGKSGSGKSTLAKIIAGVEQATSGQVFYDGRAYSIHQNLPSIQLVFQDAYQAVHSKWTIEKILQEAQRKEKNKDVIQRVLEDVELDKTCLKKYPYQLSGGQLQRVCIARALLAKAKVIIFDEALSGLDPLIQGKIIRLLHGLKQKYQQTYIFIAHDFTLCYALCHRVLVMDKGKIVEEITDFTLPIHSQYINTYIP
ncbi:MULTISPECIES: ABC transporter ATP-binding protein [unclassified Granulicatella]|uniref:ABC transporter ATP-binding protein n=1 Tax=unclassified Granulicatella TaxID=2630493 RepID=UPI001073F3B8|nr:MULTISPECIES: dipeptide/oligopeptide/nickel ABC transporter ATP-binding protein [unclassified Granulicatella]MBF0779543.1 ABC transporter ATP-binding protein [Granulicatella sp. 19428wC4_WM01]TFU96507.1 ABC transporter ATP-binding protein [Granulicatella sp. WM01]